MKSRLVCCIVGLVLGLYQTADAQPLMLQAPFGEGGTWNIYQVGDDPGQNHGFARTTWIDALEASEELVMEGVTGTLASITSAQKNEWIRQITSRDNDGQTWIGLTDREGMAPLVTNDGQPSPQESNNLPNKLTQGWAWTTGEPFTFQAWGGGEPNDSGGEDVAHIRGDGLWNDHKGGFPADFPIEAELQPGTSTDETGGPTDYKYVTEFNTRSATPFEGIRMPQVLPSGRLDGPRGQEGSFGVVEYRNVNGSDLAYNNIYRIVDSVQRIQSGASTADKFEGQLPILDVADPDTNAAGGPILTGDPIPFLSDTAGDDDDIITVAHGRIRVAEAGEYTLQVRADDGFALRFPGRDWVSASGAGVIDPMDSETLVFSAGTGDANTRGVINLPAGDHNVEFVHWERGGGAYYELTSAKGNFANEGQAQWLAVGDASEVPAVTTRPPVTLNGPLFVGNLNNIADFDLEGNYLDLIDSLGNLDAEADDITELIIDDHNTALGCPFNEFPQFHDPATVAQWPNTAGDVNNFSSIILGSLTVDDGDETPGETLTLSFHIDSDDRALLRIVGQNFEDVTGQELWEIEGDEVMYGNVDTCNTNFSGVITLDEGEYEFQVAHVENGGDAGIQILAALGDVVAGEVSASDWRLLTTSTDVNLPRNIGLALVAEIEGLLGDFNRNGILDVADIDLLTGESAGGMNPAEYDLNGDSLVDFGDITVWVKDLKNTWIGDADLNGEFNSGDLVVVLQAGTYETGVASVWSTGDFNGDGITNTGDLVAALQDGGYEIGPRAAVAAVPEPSGLLLVLVGTLAAVGSARRRTR